MFIVIVLVVSAFLFLMFRDDYRNEWLAGVGFVAGFFALIAGFIALVNQSDFAPSMAAVAETRATVESLGCTASEDVLGKANDFNAWIASGRVWNQRFIVDPFINDGVDTVTAIVIPQCH